MFPEIAAGSHELAEHPGRATGGGVAVRLAASGRVRAVSCSRSGSGAVGRRNSAR